MSKSLKSKKKLNTYLLLVVLIIAVTLGFLLAKREAEFAPEEKIKISGVWVNNFLKEKNLQKDYITLIQNENYHIFFIPSQEEFTISITSSPFEEQKKKAEEEFIKILGIDKVSSCKLKVGITTPSFVNPENAGVIYKLSFCK